MAKVKKAYYCQNCGHESPKWLGRCPNCNEWNTFVEELVVPSANQGKPLVANASKKKPEAIQNVSSQKIQRLITSDNELNRVLGGGIVPGSLILLGGEPGIGKSTLLLQMALKNPMKVLYVSGEESEQQIKMRAERIGIENTECYILTETQTQKIFLHFEQLQPDLIIVDSIQTLHSQVIDSTPGSVSQIRESTADLIRLAKETSTPVFIIGHINKEGYIAGPKVLEHMVDTVLQFEGERNYNYRLLRSIKNRFGSTNELGIYEMQSTGLRGVDNPSEILLSEREEPLSGVSVSATIEGLRPILIEVQALVSSAAYGTPQRSSTGFDLRRLNMLLAVLEKRCGFRLSSKDVFLNIAGGIKVDDPAIDLAVVSAVLSSSEDIYINPKFCFSAEVGLSGEIRPVNKIEHRIYEADKLGFSKIFVAKQNIKGLNLKTLGIEVVGVNKIEQVFEYLFG